jgi:hypothetical protein
LYSLKDRKQLLLNAQKKHEQCNETDFRFHKRVENLTAILFTKEGFHLPKYGPQYSIGKQEDTNILNTTIDTENAINLVNNGQQNICRHLAASKIKRILHSKTENNHLHKRQWHVMKQVK